MVYLHREHRSAFQTNCLSATIEFCLEHDASLLPFLCIQALLTICPWSSTLQFGYFLGAYTCANSRWLPAQTKVKQQSPGLLQALTVLWSWQGTPRMTQLNWGPNVPATSHEQCVIHPAVGTLLLTAPWQGMKENSGKKGSTTNCQYAHPPPRRHQAHWMSLEPRVVMLFFSFF